MIRRIRVAGQVGEVKFEYEYNATDEDGGESQDVGSAVGAYFAD